jgi:hypothetical protein
MCGVSFALALAGGSMTSQVVEYDPLDLESIAYACDSVITKATRELGWITIRKSLLDLVADNLPDVPLSTLKTALIVAGYGEYVR